MLHILLLEDDPSIGGRVAKQAAESGYQIRAVVNWENRLSALQYMERDSPDVVLFCASIPGKSFFDASFLMEMHRSNRFVPIVLFVEQHNTYVSKLALEFDLEWVIALDGELSLVKTVLQRLDRKHQAVIKAQTDRQQMLFLSCIKGEMEPALLTKNPYFKHYEQDTGYQIALVRILPPYRQNGVVNDNDLVRLKGCEILKNRLEGTQNYLIVQDGMDILVCLAGDQNELSQGRMLLKRYLQDMREFDLTISKVGVWICLGDVVERIEDITRSYHTAAVLIHERVFKENIALLDVPVCPNGQETSETFQVFDIRNALVNGLETFDEVSIQKILLQFKSNLISVTNLTGQTLFSIYKTLMAALFRELDRKGADLAGTKLNYGMTMKEYDRFWNMEDLFGSVGHYYKEGLHLLLTQEETSIPAPILLAKRYIRSYFDMPLSLKEISDYVGMNESYFSRYFSKYAKMTFKQYQTELRVSHSKQMLLNKQYSLEEIAEAVGYSDEKYFSRVFKRVTGVAPGEYRKDAT